MQNQKLATDSSYLYSILSKAAPPDPTAGFDLGIDEMRSSFIAKTIIELYPKIVFSSGLELTPVSPTSSEALEAWTEWEEQHLFFEKCTEAAIEARWLGDSFLVLNDGGDWEEPLRSPPTDVFRITYAYPDVEPFLTIGSDRIHESKVIHFAGIKNLIPNYTLQDGWRNKYSNLPVISGILEHTIKLLHLAPDSLITALRTSSQFILGQEGLANILYSDQVSGTNTAEQKIRIRAETINRSRNQNSIILYDRDSESLGSVTSSNVNLDSIYQSLKDAVASHSGIPSRALFDNGTVGMGSGLQNQLVARFELATKAKEWGDLHVRSKLKTLLSVFGKFTIQIPLKVALNTGEKVEYEKQLAERNKILIESGVATAEEVRASYREPGEATPIHLTLETEKPRGTVPVNTENNSETILNSELNPVADSENLETIDPELLEIDWEALIYVDVAAAIEVSEAALES